jgi:hypothetical protein
MVVMVGLRGTGATAVCAAAFRQILTPHVRRRKHPVSLVQVVLVDVKKAYGGAVRAKMMMLIDPSRCTGCAGVRLACKQ